MRTRSSFDLLKTISGDVDAYRVNHYCEIIDFLASQGLPANCSAAEFGEESNSIIKQILQHFGCSRYQHLPFPEYDLMDLKETGVRYDVLVLDQILEHVKNPFVVAEQLKKYLAPKGLILATAAFLYPVHFNKKDDYFRFTNSGLCEVFKQYDVLLTKQFGNEKFVEYLAANHWFEDGYAGGYSSNTVDRADQLGLLDDTNEDFGVTNLIIARNV
jgi:hypothetical protein